MNLSCIETHLGMTVVGPGNRSVRILRSAAVFVTGVAIMHGTLPAEQKWLQLQELVENPLKAMVTWFERFGITFKDEGDTFRLNDVFLSRERWLPLLNRTQTLGGSPVHLMQFVEKLGSAAQFARVEKVALHLHEKKNLGLRPGLLMKVGLPKEARKGDVVNESSKGDVPFLVSYDEFTVCADGSLQPLSGFVLAPVTNEAEAADILEQPAVLGFNRTYRCEEGAATGWLEDYSFDSLKAARRNVKDILRSGAEARIVNRITGDVVPLR